jgi:hypothetical protein
VVGIASSRRPAVVFPGRSCHEPRGTDQGNMIGSRYGRVKVDVNRFNIELNFEN